MTDVLTGWTFTRSIRNNAEKHIISALDAAVGCVPFPVLGMDFVGGSEFINHSVVRWAGDLDIYFTRSRPYRKNDQATIESKNNHLVRRYAFYYRYDTSEEREVLGRLWEQVNVKLNFLTPTRKPIGWGTDKAGRRKRLYDAPRTPLDRLLDTSALTKAQKTDLVSYRNQLNPASITRRIIELQDVLIRLAKDKTDQRPPHPDPQHPARRPQGRTSQASLLTTPGLRGHTYVRHRQHFAGTLTRGTPGAAGDDRSGPAPARAGRRRHSPGTGSCGMPRPGRRAPSRRSSRVLRSVPPA